MPDNELFTIALNLEKPWYVKEVKFDPSGKRLDIYVGRASELLPCPVCGKPCIDYDSMIGGSTENFSNKCIAVSMGNRKKMCKYLSHN